MLRLSILLAAAISISLGSVISGRAVPENSPCTFSSYGADISPIGENFAMEISIKANTKTDESIAEFKVGKGDASIDVDISKPDYYKDFFKIKKYAPTGNKVMNVSLMLKKSISEEYNQGSFVDRFVLYIPCTSKDSGIGSGKPVELRITVKIEPTNDHAPEFENSSYIGHIQEDFPINFTFREDDLKTIVAFDKDRYGPDSELTFILLDTELNEKSQIFNLSSQRSEANLSSYRINLFLLQPLDYEVQQTYNLTLQAKDPHFNASCIITIYVVDVDNKDPVFNRAVYHAVVTKDKISEDWVKLDPGELIYAEDGDLTNKQKIEYILDNAGSDYPDQLNVEEHNQGCQVSLKNSKKLVEEGVTYFIAIIKGQQVNNHLRVNTTVLKVKLEVPDPTTTQKASSDDAAKTTQSTFTTPDTSSTTSVENLGFPFSNYKLILSWTQEVHEVVYTVRAGGAVTYEIKDEENYFSIDPTTGDITLNKTFESDGKLLATVFAWIDGNQISNATINVLVVKRAGGLTFPQPLYEFTIEENVKPTLFALHVNNDLSARYKIVFGDTNRFDMEEKTAQLKTISQLDYEENNLYILKAKVYLTSETSPVQYSETNGWDNGRVEDDEALVMVKVIDVNEAPEFDHAMLPILVGVASFHNPGYMYHLQEAKDVDEGENGQLSYSLLEDSVAFDVLPSSGDLKLLKGRPEKKTELLTLVAQDGGNPSLNDKLPFEVFFLEDDELFIITVTLPTRSKRMTRAYYLPQHQVILKKFADILKVKVGLVQADWNADDSARTDLCLFAKKDEKIVKFADVKQMLKEKQSELENEIGPYDLAVPNALGKPLNNDSGESEPSATIIAVYVLSAVVFGLVAAALGLFIFRKWSQAAKSKAAKAKAADSVDYDGSVDANQRTDDASEAILNNEFYEALEANEEPAAQIYNIDTDNRTQLMEAIQSADGGIENPLAQLNAEPTRNDAEQLHDEPVTHTALEYEIKDLGTDDESLKAWPSPLNDTEETNTVAPSLTYSTGVEPEPELVIVTDQIAIPSLTYSMEVEPEPELVSGIDQTVTSSHTHSVEVEPEVVRIGHDHKFIDETVTPSVTHYVEVEPDYDFNLTNLTTTPEGEVELAATSETAKDTEQYEPEQCVDVNNTTNEEQGAEAKPIKKCLKTDPQHTKRKSIVTFNETAEVITEEIIETDYSESIDL